MDANSVGPFAGSTGAAPGYVAKVDYFFDTAAPIIDEDSGVPPGNTPPVATDDTGVTQAGVALTLNTSDLLANDTDADGDPLQFEGFTQPVNGTLVDNSDGTLTYTPNAGFDGADSFDYTVGDGTDSDTGTVNITVDPATPGNTPPVATDDTGVTQAGVALTLNTSDLLANDTDADGDPLQFEGFTQPVNGTLVDNSDGTLTYTPNAGFDGADSFDYTVGDGTDSDTGTVNITVDPAGSPGNPDV